MLVLAIRTYWFLWPAHLRRTCLFKETCSRLVCRIAVEEGDLAAMRAFLTRWRRCRPGYDWFVEDGNVTLVVADATRVGEQDIADWLVEGIRKTARDVLSVATEAVDDHGRGDLARQRKAGKGH